MGSGLNLLTLCLNLQTSGSPSTTCATTSPMENVRYYNWISSPISQLVTVVVPLPWRWWAQNCVLSTCTYSRPMYWARALSDYFVPCHAKLSAALPVALSVGKRVAVGRYGTGRVDLESGAIYGTANVYHQPCSQQKYVGWQDDSVLCSALKAWEARRRCIFQHNLSE